MLAYGDEWMPNRDRDLAGRIDELSSRAEREIPVSYFGAEPTPEAVEALERAGVGRVFFGLPSEAPAVVEDALDQAAAVAGRWT